MSDRARGPFDGYRVGAVDLPLRVRDLSVYGCLIELDHHVVIGRRSRLQIHLPSEGWIAVKADMLRVRGTSWLAATFVNLDQATWERLTRGIGRSARSAAPPR